MRIESCYVRIDIISVAAGVLDNSALSVRGLVRNGLFVFG